MGENVIFADNECLGLKKKFNHVMAKILNFWTTKQQTENLFKAFIENSTKLI